MSCHYHEVTFQKVPLYLYLHYQSSRTNTIKGEPLTCLPACLLTWNDVTKERDELKVSGQASLTRSIKRVVVVVVMAVDRLNSLHESWMKSSSFIVARLLVVIWFRGIYLQRNSFGGGNERMSEWKRNWVVVGAIHQRRRCSFDIKL